MRILQLTACLALYLTSSVLVAADPTPPEGFRPLFNGRDLSGWHGLNPHAAARLTGEEKEANLQKQRAEFAEHWRVEDGALVNDGHGPYANTDEEFGDIELMLEYRTVAGADSGIYLRGTPQVQIWDWHQSFDPARPTRKPHLGSGGLFNNSPNSAGRHPMQFADRPLGEWNQFRIRQIGARTWVWLNGKLVVDGAHMHNYWDREEPLPARGPIMLQTHGGEIRWRNLFVREFGTDEAEAILAAADSNEKSLAESLTLHAPFDERFDAAFSRGDRTAYVRQGKELHRAEANPDVTIEAETGRYGGAMRFPHKSSYRPAFRGAGVLDYNDENWSATVSVWLRLTPDEDLEPGYCDPVQIIGNDSKKGFVFLEWSKDETPRYFRYAIRPLSEIWNPNNVSWAEIPFEKRPMVQVERAPFSREKWTHVVFTLENVNDDESASGGRLYINGEPQGSIDGWDLTFGWEPESVLLVLGAAYVGRIDDLAVFDRVLTEAEVKQIYGLQHGVRELYAPGSDGQP